MRFILAAPIKRRIPYREDLTQGILLYDTDNLYPQRVEEILNLSAAGKSSVNLFAKFVRGRGFADKAFNTAVINAAGDTVKDLLRDCVDDYAKFKGFAIHVDYNAFLQPINAKYIPFTYVRYGLPDDRGVISKVVLSDDWALEKRRSIQRRQTVDLFNPDPEVILKQIHRAGGIGNYKGQILYVTESKFKYPLCSFDPVLADVETDGEISAFKHSNVTTNFMASHIVEMAGEFDSEDERDEMQSTLRKFQGARNAGKILLFENKHGADKPLQIHKVEIQNNDQLFKWTEESSATKIRKNYTQPAILVGDLVPGRLGNTQELENSFMFYNEFTTDDRMIVEENFAWLFSIYAIPVNPSGNYSIEELSFSSTPKTSTTDAATGEAKDAPKTNETFTKLSGKQWIQLNRVVRDFAKEKISIAQAMIGLKAFGLTEEECKEYLGIEEPEPQQQ